MYYPPVAFHVFHGTDYFRLDRAYRALLAQRGVSPAELTVFDGTSQPPSVTDLYHAAFSGSLFGPAPGVLMHNASAWMKYAFKAGAKGRMEAADIATLHDITHAPDDVLVVFVELEGLLPKTPPTVWKEIAAGAGSRLTQIDQLKFIPYGANPELEKLITGLAGERNLKMSPEATKALAWRCGSDLGLLWAELGKYADWTLAHPKQKIDAELINRETIPTAEVYIFDLIDTISSRQLKRALSLMHLILQGGEPAVKVLTLIHRQYKQLFMVMLSRGTPPGMPDWMARKMRDAGKGYRPQQLPQVLRLLLETDRALKTSQMPDTLAMEMLVMRLCTL